MTSSNRIILIVFSYLSCPERDDFDIEELIEDVITRHKSKDVEVAELKNLNYDNFVAGCNDLVNTNDLNARKCLSYSCFEKIKSNLKDSCYNSKELSFFPVNKDMTEEMKLSQELCYRVRKTISSRNNDPSKLSKSSKTIKQKYGDSALKFDDFLLENHEGRDPCKNAGKSSSKTIKKVERSSILLKLESASSQYLDT